MKTRRGLTLIELILSISIIGIFSTVLLGIFNTGMLNVVNAGKRTNEVLIIKDKVEEKTIDPTVTNQDLNDLIKEDIEQGQIVYVEGLSSEKVAIEGTYITVETSDESEFSILIDVFIPDLDFSTE